MELSWSSQSYRRIEGLADSSFYPAFAAPKGEEVGVAKIADHIEHIADRIGRHQYATSCSGGYS